MPGVSLPGGFLNMELVLPARKIRGPRVLCCNIKLSSVSKDGIYENSLGLYIYMLYLNLDGLIKTLDFFCFSN